MLKRLFQKTFLNHLMGESKVVGYVVGVLILIQIISFVAVKETTPFFLYGMYSEIIPKEETNARLRLMVDGQHIKKSDLNRFTHELLFASLEYYDQLYINNFDDPLEDKIDSYFANMLSPSLIAELKEELLYQSDEHGAYQAWLKRYLERNLGHEIHSIQLEKDTYSFDHSNRSFISSQTILEYNP